MGAKVRVITAIALLLMIVIILGACTPEVQLPVLREASDFTLTNQDGLEVNLSDFRGKVVVMDFIYTSCPDICGLMNHKLRIARDQLDAPHSADDRPGEPVQYVELQRKRVHQREYRLTHGQP